MIHLGSQQLIQHVHCGGEEHTLIGLTGTPTDDFGQVCLAHTGIADEAHAGAVAQKVEIQETQDAGLQLSARLVMVKVETVDRRLGLQAGDLEATFDGTLVTVLDFAIDECFQGLCQAEIFGRRLSQHLIQMVAHDRQVQLLQFLL